MTSEVTRMELLLVEDDALLASAMRRRLEGMDFNVRLVETCDAAANAWEATPPDVVFMDFRLPDGWGTDVVRQLRRRGRREPVIFMTAESESLSQELREELSITDVLGKPVSKQDLQKAIDGLGAVRISKPMVGLGSRHRYGRFRLVHLRGRIDGQRVARLCRAAQDERWLALRLSMTHCADDSALRGICAWAGWLSSQGGRLCMITDSSESARALWLRMDGFVEVIDSLERLKGLGLRLTGAAERQQLLNAVASLKDQGV